MMMTASLPIVPWHVLEQVFPISAFFAISAVVIFSVVPKGMSTVRDSNQNGLVRTTASAVVLVATVGVLNLGYLGFHYIMAK